MVVDVVAREGIVVGAMVVVAIALMWIAIVVFVVVVFVVVVASINKSTGHRGFNSSCLEWPPCSCNIMRVLCHVSISN